MSSATEFEFNRHWLEATGFSVSTRQVAKRDAASWNQLPDLRLYGLDGPPVQLALSASFCLC